ncbi:uncharacterized protein [Euphorbia lathyris]|uniref:uncharacterized protein n=1 Tax=Euphorbia lathyris TaxID=212925 RepID=UPI00331386F6
MHACNARFLGLFHKEIASKQHSFTKDLHAFESNIIGNIDGPKTDRRSMGATNNMNQKHLGTLFSEKQVLITQGNEHIIVSSEKDLPQKSEIKDLKRQERSMVGTAASDVEESNEKDIADDIEVMDYAQPHRKPPIHNQKP